MIVCLKDTKKYLRDVAIGYMSPLPSNRHGRCVSLLREGSLMLRMSLIRHIVKSSSTTSLNVTSKLLQCSNCPTYRSLLFLNHCGDPRSQVCGVSSQLVVM